MLFHRVNIFRRRGVNSLSCVSINNQERKTRQKIVDTNRDDPASFPFSIKTSKCSDRCNYINNLHAKLCVSDVKIFKIMSRTNEARHIKWKETCKCKCKFNSSVCNNKQRWNNDECRCKCKEFIYEGVCNKESIWNPSNCKCKCDKSCDVGEYFDYENCKCRKKLVDKLVEECTETVEEVALAKINSTKNKKNIVITHCKPY